MIGALMLIFVMSAAGESATAAISFSSMEECESARATAIEGVKASPTPSGAPIMFVAAVCTKPIEVEVL